MKKTILLFSLLLVTFVVRAQSSPRLELEKVLVSVEEKYPLVLEALQNVEASKMKVLQAQGLFDSKLLAKGDSRSEGYYDGKSLDVVAVKPLAFMNSEIYGGYKISEGEYPSYERNLETLDEGEARIGLGVSLLRNRALDERRGSLQNSKLDLKSKKFQLRQKVLSAKRKAFVAYWEWVAKGNIHQTYKGLLELAKKRTKGLEERIKQGDMAKIYGLENRQYVARRKTMTIQAKRDFLQAALELALYYRDEEGEPIFPSEKMLPREIEPIKKVEVGEIREGAKHAVRHNPTLSALQVETEQMETLVKVADNELMPKLDLRFELSKDRGEGSPDKRPQEARLKLSFEFPLERNLGRGKVGAAKARQKALSYQRRLARETLQTQTKSLAVQITALVEELQNIQEEVTLAQKLQSAEEEKFKRGVSDFFVVNLREQDAADAQVKYYKELLEYKKMKAAYKEITLNF